MAQKELTSVLSNFNKKLHTFSHNIPLLSASLRILILSKLIHLPHEIRRVLQVAQSRGCHGQLPRLEAPR